VPQYPIAAASTIRRHQPHELAAFLESEVIDRDTIDEPSDRCRATPRADAELADIVADLPEGTLTEIVVAMQEWLARARGRSAFATESSNRAKAMLERIGARRDRLAPQANRVQQVADGRPVHADVRTERRTRRHGADPRNASQHVDPAKPNAGTTPRRDLPSGPPSGGLRASHSCIATTISVSVPSGRSATM